VDGIDTNSATSDGSGSLDRAMRGAQTDRSVLSLTGETLIIRIIVLGISFISNIIVARQLGPEGRGILAVIIFWSSLIATIAIFGLDSALIYLLGSSRGRFHRLIFFFTVYLAIAATLVGTALYSISILWGIPNISGALIWFLIGLTIITMLQILLNASFIGVGRISLVNVSALISTCFYLFLLIILYIQKRTDTQLILWANVGAQMLTLVILCWASWNVPRSEAAPIVIPKALAYALKAYLGNIANLLSMRANFLVLSLLVPVTELGVFAIAQVFSDLILFLPNTLMNVLLPRITGLPEPEVVQRVSQIVRCTMIAALVVAVGIGGFATVAIPVVFGKDFALAVPIVWLLTTGSWFGSGGMVLSIYFNAIGRPEVPASTAWLGLVVTLVLTVVFATFFGGIGAAAALCFARAITTVWMLLIYRRSTRAPWVTVLIAQRSDWQLGSQTMRTWYAHAVHFHKA
jgi:O-antigen/teichoic acid export membrane protein